MSTLTEYPPTAIGEKAYLRDVAEAVSADAAPGSDETAPYVPQDATDQQSAETVQVEAVNIKKFIEKGFKEPDMLKRHRVVNEKLFPWRTVGKLFVGEGSISNILWTGSGVLVGKNLILTAGHAIPWGKEKAWIRFIPAFNNDAAPYGSSFIKKYYGYHQDGEVNGLDYVICKLETPLGDSTGWMGSKSYANDSDYYKGNWVSVGYPSEPANPGAQFMVVEKNVKILDVDDEGSEGKELETHLYSLGGWSGGPLWAYLPKEPHVIGIMSGDETDFLQPRHSVSAGGIAMVNLVKWGMAKWG